MKKRRKILLIFYVFVKVLLGSEGKKHFCFSLFSQVFFPNGILHNLKKIFLKKWYSKMLPLKYGDPFSNYDIYQNLKVSRHHSDLLHAQKKYCNYLLLFYAKCRSLSYTLKKL